MLYAVSGRWFSANGGDCGSASERLAFYSASGFGVEGGGHVQLSRRKPSAAPDKYDTEGIDFASRADLLKLVEQTPALSTCKQIVFTYLDPGVPPRTSFTVHFADGKVTSVSEPHTWD